MGNADAGAQQILRDLNQINVAVVILLIGGGWLLVTILERVLPWVGNRMPSRFRNPILGLVPILRLLTLAFVTIEVIPQLINPTPTNLLAIMGAIGVALGFAFKDYISSIIAGLVTIYERPYRPGDWVRVEDVYGEVKSVGSRSFIVTTPDDTTVTIPHSKIWNVSIYNANYGMRDQLCVAEFYLNPDHDAKAVRQTLLDVALTSPYLNLDRPVVATAAEKPWATHYRLKAYPMDGRKQFQFTTDLTIRAKAALKRIGANPVHSPVLMTST